MAVYYRCPDIDVPKGGVRVIYRHVDILVRNGIEAYVLHGAEPFRCTWFDNATPVRHVSPRPTLPLRAARRVRRFSATRRGISAAPALKLGANDFVAIPEVMALQEVRLWSSPKVIFNQNAYFTFRRWPDDVLGTPYLDESVRAVVVVSEDNGRYVAAGFPDLPLMRTHNSIDPAHFRFTPEKKRQLTYMPRKHPGDAAQVLRLLRLRGALNGWDVVPISGMTEAQTAAVLRESAVFLSFGHPEGCPTPPLEAMRCGCVVIGYHGMGGREYFLPELTFPIEFGDIRLYVETVERVLTELRERPEPLQAMTKRASGFVGHEYSPEREEQDVLDIWSRLGVS